MMPEVSGDVEPGNTYKVPEFEMQKDSNIGKYVLYGALTLLGGLIAYVAPDVHDNLYPTTAWHFNHWLTGGIGTVAVPSTVGLIRHLFSDKPKQPIQR